MLQIVNMIPRSLSGETEQDSEPNIAVNPEDPSRIVATAFTPDPMSGAHAPIYVSTDGGATWRLQTIVPGGPMTSDITVAFGSTGGALYAGILNGQTLDLNVLRTADPFSPTAMTVLDDRAQEDQPWTSAITVTTGTGAQADHVYMGHNNFNAAGGQTASVELSPDARTAAPPAGFATHSIERRSTIGQDGPPVRTAVHPDGTVYAAFQPWMRLLKQTDTFAEVEADIVVCRDDSSAGGANPFASLVDPLDHHAGVRVATNRLIHFTATVGPLGQERIGADLAIAVEPGSSRHVWLAWADRVGGRAGTDWTVHVRCSLDGGASWTGDLRRVTNAKNPSLAVSSDGVLGFMFQQLVGSGSAARWVTQLELTADSWGTPATSHVLHSASASQPQADFLPYLGDYLRLVAVNTAFYGVFSGSNLPDRGNFPNGVTYQRNANWNTRTLLGTDNRTVVRVSIDPFFVHAVPDPGAGQWHHADLSTATAAPAATGRPVAFTDEQARSRHVFVRCAGHIAEFTLTLGAPTFTDVSSATGAPDATESAAAYLDAVTGMRHVFFPGTDGHIHELWWRPSDGWHHHDLTAATAAPAAAGPPAAHMDELGRTQHVFFRGTDGHIHELWWRPSDGWHHDDLTAAANTPAAAGPPTAYIDVDRRAQHVVFVGADGHVHELWWVTASGWHHHDLTAATNAPNAATQPSGSIDDSGRTQHVVYATADGRVHDLWWVLAGGWNHSDLSAIVGAPAAGGSPFCFVDEGAGGQEVVYVGGDGHVHELRWS